MGGGGSVRPRVLAVPAAALAAVFLWWSACSAATRAEGNAEGSTLLTLGDALRLAAERNRDIQKALEFRNQVEGRYLEERATALPQVTATGAAVRSRDETQALFFGGSAPALTTSTVKLGASQVLFTWGQVGAAIRAADIARLTAEDQLRLYRQAAARDVTRLFYDTLLAKELNTLARQTVEQRLRHLDEAERRRTAGTATDYDVLAAEVTAENARPEVIRTENLVRITLDRLRYLLALEDEIEIQGSLAAGIAPWPSYDEAWQTARMRRPELAEIRHRTGIAREIVTVARGTDKPRAEFRGDFGWGDVEVMDRSVSGKEWSAGVFLSWPVFDGFRTRGRVMQAESDLANLRIDERKLLDSIALDVRSAQNAAREATEVVKALTGTVAQAERLLFMAEKGFEYGVKTKLDVDDAELNLNQARSNLARANRDYLVARTNLEWVMGILGEES